MVILPIQQHTSAPAGACSRVTGKVDLMPPDRLAETESRNEHTNSYKYQRIGTAALLALC
jgi:hypothetical protein